MKKKILLGLLVSTVVAVAVLPAISYACAVDSTKSVAPMMLVDNATNAGNAGDAKNSQPPATPNTNSSGDYSNAMPGVDDGVDDAAMPDSDDNDDAITNDGEDESSDQ